MNDTEIPKLYAKYGFWKSVNECEPGMWVALTSLSLSCGGYAWYKMGHWIVGAAVGAGVFAILAIVLVLATFNVRVNRDNAYRAYLMSKNGNANIW